MKIAIGADHRGHELKSHLCEELGKQGHEVRDCGCAGTAPADYPVPALAVGELVAAGEVECGILICGSGIGVSIAANKVPGVRASLCHDPDAARLTRRHNDSNVLCLSGDKTAPAAAAAIAAAYLDASFEGGRHARRRDLITAYEARSTNRGVS